MASLASFPGELVLIITSYLDTPSDVAALARVCRATYPFANSELYRRSRWRYRYLLYWASELGRIGTVRHLLAAGAVPDNPWGWDDYPSFREKFFNTFSQFGLRDAFGRDCYYLISRPKRAFGEGRVYSSEEMVTLEDTIKAMGGDEGVGGTVSMSFKPSSWMLDDPIFPSLHLDKSQTTATTTEKRETRPHLWYPLHLAARGGHIEVAELLLSYGADIDRTTQRICACKRTGLNCRGRHDGLSFYWRQENTDCELLEKYSHLTPLHMALCHQQQEMAIVLLQRGAARIFDNPGWEAHVLHTAAAFGCLDVVKFLIEGDDAIDINIQDSRGLTPLFYAYSAHQRETMLWLLQKKADVDVQLGAGLTLLHLACLDGAFAIACSLIDAGADVNRPWAETICPYLGQLRPLELCCALHHTKARRAYAQDPLLHERRFELGKLELIKKLLDAGATTRPITRPRQGPQSFPSAEVSAVTIAASQHSIPMLELLAASGVDMSREASAIREAIYPTFMEWRDLTNRDPLATLRWLVAHGVPVESESILTVDALIFVCGLPVGCPWRAGVLEWLLSYNVQPDLEVKVPCVLGQFERVHEMHIRDAISVRSMTPFQEALRVGDFATCKALLSSRPRPSLVEAFQRLVSWATYAGYETNSWQNGYLDPEQPYRENHERLEFLLEADEEETVKNAPGTFLNLLDAATLPPSNLLLDAALPTKDAFLERFPKQYDRTEFATEQVNRFFNLQSQYDATEASRDWDSAVRLVMAILRRSWNAAHFLIQHGADMAWAQENGMEYFPPVLSALRLAPSPSVIGRDTYHALLGRWNEREGRIETDVRTALFHEACSGPVDITHFLADGEIDVNAVDGKGNSALHRMWAYHDEQYLLPSTRDPHAAQRMLQLFRAGVDPRTVNHAGEDVLDNFIRATWGRWPLLSSIEFFEEITEESVAITVRLDGVDETFVYE